MDENEITDKKQAMDSFFKYFLKDTKDIHYVFHYDTGDFNEYDCAIFQKDKKTKNINKRLFFNAFITSNHYEAIVLEQIKLNLLKLEKENLIYFVEDEKTKKQVALLELSNGKFFNFVFTPKSDMPIEKQAEDIQIQREIVFDASDYDLPIKRDENGDIYFDGLNDMQRYPESVMWEYVHQERIKSSLLPNENKEEMLKEHGGVVKLGEFLAKRNMGITMDIVKKSIFDRREKFLKRFRNG